GVKVTGCTVHVVTNDVDAGPILAQATVPVLPGDTVESLAARILLEEHRLYPEVLQRIAAGRDVPIADIPSQLAVDQEDTDLGPVRGSERPQNGGSP
ncbi:MAG: phosphoribosylglycinamide formyltransferase, partial [Chloroflexota bacterium]